MHERDDRDKAETKRICLGDGPEIQMIEGKDEVCHDRYATWESFFQLIATTFEIPFETIKVLD